MHGLVFQGAIDEMQLVPSRRQQDLIAFLEPDDFRAFTDRQLEGREHLHPAAKDRFGDLGCLTRLDDDGSADGSFAALKLERVYAGRKILDGQRRHAARLAVEHHLRARRFRCQCQPAGRFGKGLDRRTLADVP